MPELLGRNALVPAVQGLGDHRLVFVAHALHDDFAVAFELPEDVAHVLDPILAGQHRALVYLLFDPGGRDAPPRRRAAPRATPRRVL